MIEFLSETTHPFISIVPPLLPNPLIPLDGKCEVVEIADFGFATSIGVSNIYPQKHCFGLGVSKLPSNGGKFITITISSNLIGALTALFFTNHCAEL